MKNYPLYELLSYRDFPELLRGLAGKYGDAPAITCYTADGAAVTHTYAQLERNAENAAALFAEMGFAGKNITLIGENSYGWLIAFFGAATAGKTVTPIDLEQSTETIRNAVLHVDTELLVLSASAQAVVREIPELAALPALGMESEEYRAVLEKTEPPAEPAPILCENILVYTSGTTSAPKAVMLTPAGILSNAGAAGSMVRLIPPVYTSLPFYHVYGLTCGLIASLLIGANVCVNGSLKTMIRDLRLFGPKTVMAVPLIAEQFYKMLRSAAPGVSETAGKPEKRRLFEKKRAAVPSEEALRVKRELFGELELIVCGGAHLSQEVIDGLASFGILVLQGYGITECSPLVCVNRNMNYSAGTVGLPLPNTEVRLSAEGEILVRGPGVTAGYYKEPELTKTAFENGWFKTGDEGAFDRRGFLRISGRIKNLIVMKNGKKVLPEEMEGYLMKIPLVKSAVVYGAKTGVESDDVKIAASVYPDPAVAADATPYEILAKLQEEINGLNRRLPIYKQIQIVNLSNTEQERTALGKARRNQN